jgi:hypothetical protein
LKKSLERIFILSLVIQVEKNEKKQVLIMMKLNNELRLVLFLMITEMLNNEKTKISLMNKLKSE